MKKILSILLVATLLLGCTACKKENPTPTAEKGEGKETLTQTLEGTESTEDTQDEETTGEEVTVVYWSNNRHDMEYVTEKISSFNEENKGNIQIDYVVQTDNYINMITMASSSNQAPDIFSISAATGGFDLRSFAEGGIVRDINEYLEAAPDFVELINLDSYRIEGLNVLEDDVYWYPRTIRSGNRLIYNKELFEKAGLDHAPTTLDELVEAAKKITEVGEGTQFGCTVPGQSGALSRMIVPIAEISGVKPYDYAKGEFNFDGYKPVLEAFRTMFEEGYMLPGSASMKVDPTRVQFAEGNVGFYGNASQEVGVLTSQFPAKIEWSAAALPSVDGEIKGALTATPFDGTCMSAQTQHPDETFEVIRWISGMDFMKGYVEAGLATSASPQIMEAADLSGIGKMEAFAPLDYESVYPPFPSVAPQGKNWEDALWETCIAGGADIDQTIEELNRTYNEALDREVEMGKVKRIIIEDYNPLKPLEGNITY